MFQAILYGKYDEKGLMKHNPVLYEDILTSDVFGAFRYLPSRYIITWAADVLSSRKTLLPRIAGRPEIEFWPRFDAPEEDQKQREPDVLIRWPKLWLVVEAKRGSDLTRSQLEGEYKAVSQALRRSWTPDSIEPRTARYSNAQDVLRVLTWHCRQYVRVEASSS